MQHDEFIGLVQNRAQLSSEVEHWSIRARPPGNACVPPTTRESIFRLPPGMLAASGSTWPSSSPRGYRGGGCLGQARRARRRAWRGAPPVAVRLARRTTDSGEDAHAARADEQPHDDEQDAVEQRPAHDRYDPAHDEYHGDEPQDELHSRGYPPARSAKPASAPATAVGPSDLPSLRAGAPTRRPVVTVGVASGRRPAGARRRAGLVPGRGGGDGLGDGRPGRLVEGRGGT